MVPEEKRDRLVEAAAAILNAAPDSRLNIVVLNKVLFYLDLASLRDRSETLTGNSYIAIQQGPVVANYPKRLVEELESRGIARQISEWDGSKPVLLESPPEHFKFVDSDAMSLAGRVTSFFSRLSSTQASNYSHENPGWQLAWNKCRVKGTPQPVNMRVALQQIIEDDPWMDSALTDDELLLKAADDGLGVDW